MTAPHVLDQLPHWIEGDLSSHERIRLEAHLVECPTCHEAAEELRTSQAWLREALVSPFDPTDAARLRRRVMDQIREEAAAQPIQRFRVRPALLAACAATLLMASLVWRRERGHSLQPATVGIPQPIKVAGGRTVSIPEAAPKPIRDHRHITPLPKSRVAPVPRAEAESPPEGLPARIEFQTADPTIRIIWLAQAKPLSETTSSFSETP